MRPRMRAGSRMSRSRRPESCRNSNRLPATVATRLGSDAPILSIGQDSVTRACRRTGSARPWDLPSLEAKARYLCVLNSPVLRCGLPTRCLQLWSFTGNRDERSARLLARPSPRPRHGGRRSSRSDNRPRCGSDRSRRALSRASLCGTRQRRRRRGHAHSDAMQRQHPDSS